jgi:hypothetical protein
MSRTLSPGTDIPAGGQTGRPNRPDWRTAPSVPSFIGTVLCGSGSGEGSRGKVTLGLPRTLGSGRAEENV